jgi:ATP-dependent Zn protease
MVTIYGLSDKVGIFLIMTVLVSQNILFQNLILKKQQKIDEKLKDFIENQYTRAVNILQKIEIN